MSRLLTCLAAGSALLLGACSPEPAWDPEYRTKYQKVMDCAPSADHALMNVVIYADEQSAPAYADGGPTTVPEGSVVVKEEFLDSECTELSGYAVMRKDGAKAPAGGDGWLWQVADAQGVVTEEGAMRACVSCHRGCGGGHDLLCATQVE